VSSEPRFLARIEALRALLESDEVDAMLVTDVANMRYVTGFDRVFDDMINAAVVVAPDSLRFYTDARYVEAARTAAGDTGWDVRCCAEKLYEQVCTDLAAAGAETIAVESSVPHARFVLVSDCFSGRVVVADHWVNRLRLVKDDVELDAAARAAALTDATFEHILGVLRPGLREIDVSLALELYMRSNGSEGLAFGPIVASGPNSSRPHAGVTTRVIEPGDILTMDFGARVDGYCADLTRTVVVGAKATVRQRELYDAVLAANMAGIEAVRAGVRAREVDAAARDLLTGMRLGEYFTHSLGHGVGLEVHEQPRLSTSSDDILRAGSIVTIEPGVYVAGELGVRIEDLVAVEESGSRLLSHAPKGLIEIV
jgi:Xaa-Pro aminopeptidase